MTQPYLYMRNRSTTAPQCAVFKEINRQLIQIGNDFGTSEGTAVTKMRCENRAIHWENDVYAVNHDTIYKYDVLAGGSGGTGDWEPFYTFADKHVNANSIPAVMGLIPCSIDGSGVLCTAYPTTNVSNDHIRVVKIDKDLNVTEGPEVLRSSSALFTVNNNQWASAQSYRNEIIWGINDGVYATYSYDLKTDALTRIIPPDFTSSAGPGTSQYAVLRDTLYFVHQQDRADVGGVEKYIGIWRLDGGISTNVGYITSVIHHPRFDGCLALMAFNDKLYLCGSVNGTSYGALYEIEIDANGLAAPISPTAVTTNLSSLLPGALTSTWTGGFKNHFKTLWRIDSITTGPENPIVELEVSTNGDADGTRGLWTWNTAPTGNNWTFQGNVMNGRQFSWVNVMAGSTSPYMWAGSGVLNAQQPCLSISSDALAIDVQTEIFGTPGQSGISLEVYFDKEGETVETKGKIAAPTKGVLVGNTVTNLAVGDILSVRWEAVSDGIQPGDNPKVALKVSRP